jgi:hypothetical protein
MSRQVSRVVFGVMAASAFLLAVTPAHANGGCIAARVNDQVVLPDGSLHEAGIVTICPETRLSPSVRLCSIAVNGRTAGIWMNRVSEGGRFVADDGTVALRRLASGHLALADYYWPGPDGRPVTATTAARREEPAVEAAALFSEAFRLPESGVDAGHEPLAVKHLVDAP